ncbi:MAG TPA: ISL3 family transposase [Sphaerochaeta sp.]|jgi:transposase|nr:ISL3 family transposase [Sphaerochaeta sp.]
MDGIPQNDIFTQALGLAEPWFVSRVEFRPSEKEPGRLDVHITLDYQKGSKFPCPHCGDLCTVYDSNQKEWRHLNFFQYRCYIHARVPRVECKDHKVTLIEVPWARKGSGFTLLMEAVLLTMLRQMSVRQVAKQVGEHDTRLWRQLKGFVRKALESQDFSDVKDIGVDEYSHKGHEYITVFLAHPTKKSTKARVLYTTEGKDNSTVTRFGEKFKEKKGKPDEVKNITCDMTHGFRNSMNALYPKATTTVDRFHVMKMANDAVDTIRRRELRSKDSKKCKALDKTRFLWLKNRENLNEDQLKQLDLLLDTEYLDTVTAYNFRLKLQDVYACNDYDTAVEAYEELCLQLCNSNINEMKKLGKSLVRNAIEILNFFDSRKTNAVLEGFNSVISLIKRKARGFKNMENFMTMIYFVCGELELPKATIM